MPPVIQSADSSLTKLCNRPIDLGNKPLTQKDIEKLWSTDRAFLVNCYNRHKALVKFFEERDRLLLEAIK